MGFSRMKTKPSGWIVRWACLLLLLVSSLAPIGIRAAVVYDNTALAGMTKDGVFLLTEYGDEIALVGTDRWVTQFDIATFGDFPTNAVVNAVVRIYANDGTDALDGPHYAYRPKTVLWESPPFTLKPGGQTATFAPLIRVPDTFTWTIRFTGVQQVTGNSVGPIVVNPIQIGAPLANGHTGSYPDYWRKDGASEDSWMIYLLSSGTPANFYVKVTATPEPATLPNLKVVRSGNSPVLEVFGTTGKPVIVESSGDLRTWAESFRVTGKGPGNPERVSIVSNTGVPMVFWRAREN
jgi:hypothetical protein